MVLVKGIIDEQSEGIIVRENKVDHMKHNY